MDDQATLTPVSGSETDPAPWRRVRAGILAEAGLAPKDASKRWQKRIIEGEFDADACADDLLGGPSPPGLEERIGSRTSTLLRDFLMASHQRGVRGGMRKARGAARSTFAFFLTQLLVLVVFFGLFAALLLVARFKEWDVNGLLDQVLDLARPQ